MSEKSKYCPKCKKYYPSGAYKKCPECKTELITKTFSFEKDKEGKIYYSKKYWTFFLIQLLGNVLCTFFPLILIGLLIYYIYFITIIHKSFKEVKINYGWLIGLLIFIPIGFWIVFFIARHKLKKVNKWTKPTTKEVWECDYCKKQFDNKGECREHEKECRRKG